MKLANLRFGAFLLLTSLLPACGGGGGDGGGGGGNNNNTEPRLSTGPTSISVSGTPGDVAPQGSFTLTITNVPTGGLTLRGRNSSSGIQSVGFMQVSATGGQLSIQFRSPGALANGTYEDDIEIQVCPDENCASQIDGSPALFSTTYEVSGDGPTTVAFDRDAIQLTIEALEPMNRSEQFRATLNVVPDAGTFWSFENSNQAVQHVELSRPSTSEAVFTVAFHPSELLGPGTYDDTVDVRVCYDLSCVRHVRGSPFTLTSNVIVGIGAEPGYDPLVVDSRTALSHDIIDAAFSQSLRQVVMISADPVNALYTYDMATGVERQQLLPALPAAVSLAPDGLTAAVAHVGQISIVDLSALAQPAPPAPILLDVSIDVVDLVLDGEGRVHALERFNTWGSIHSVDIATNTEQTSVGPLIESDSRARLHPSGDFLYAVPGPAGNGSTFSRWSISTGQAEWLRDSPFVAEHGLCGDLWFHEGGTRIYSVCGHTFQSSDAAVDDMVYAGSFALSEHEGADFEISSLSHSGAQAEVALIEYDPKHCGAFNSLAPCYSHLGLYDPDLLSRTAVFSIPPVTVDDVAYRQQGLFVFHDETSGKKVMLSRFRDMEDPNLEYYLSVVP